MIYLGADHGGFELKEAIKQHLLEQGYEVEDCGTHSAESVDYAPIAQATCEKLLADTDYFSAKYTRLHNDANVLCMGGRVVGAGLACELVDVFLNTEFEGGRHQRRVDQITAIEQSQG